MTDPGDVPGLAPFEFASSTVTITPSGTVDVTCIGQLPDDVTVADTYVGTLVCRGDTPDQDVGGRITITRAGRAVLHCQFPGQGTPPAPGTVDASLAAMLNAGARRLMACAGGLLAGVVVGAEVIEPDGAVKGMIAGLGVGLLVAALVRN